ARTAAASIIAALLARWKHTYLHDRESYDSDFGATPPSVKGANSRRFHSLLFRFASSLDFQVQRLDHLRPALAFLFDESRKLLGTHVANLDADIFHPANEIAACRKRVKLLAKPFDYRGGRPSRSIQRHPGRGDEIGTAELLCERHVRQNRRCRI